MEHTRIKVESEVKEHQPIILFDVDNTLVDGFTIFPFAEHLAKNHLLDPNTPSIMHQDLTYYENGEFSYQEFAKAVVDHYYQGLAGIAQEMIETAGESYFEEYKEKLFPYSTNLVDLMNTHGRTIVISGAPREAFLPMSKYLNIAESFMLEGEIIDGHFTGKTKVNMALETVKRQIVNILTERDYSRIKSFAFGDSSSDIPILEAVSNPFIVNPKGEFAELAARNGWRIVNSNNIIQETNQIIEGLNI